MRAGLYSLNGRFGTFLVTKWRQMMFIHGTGVLAEKKDLKDGEILYRESLAIAQEIGDRRGTAVALANLGLILCEQDKIEEARSHNKQAFALLEEICDRQQAALVTCYTGMFYLKQGEDVAA